MVQRSRELLKWSCSVSWLIATADQILQWTWKKKCHGLGALFKALRKPDPPFTNSYGSSICWRKQPNVAPPKFTDAEKFAGSRRHCSTYFKWVSSRLVTSSRSLPEIVLGTNCGKHSAILVKDPSHGGRKKEKKKIRTETWVKLAIKPEEINFNQSIIFLCPLFSGYLSSIAKTELTYPPTKTTKYSLKHEGKSHPCHP